MVITPKYIISLVFWFANRVLHIIRRSCPVLPLFMNKKYDCYYFRANLGSASLSVSYKLVSILAVRQIIRLHPLGGVLSSLRSNTRHSCNRAKINLKPLMPISPLCAPGPSVSTSSTPVHSSTTRSAVVVVIRGSTHHFIVDALVFETKWHVTAI